MSKLMELHLSEHETRYMLLGTNAKSCGWDRCVGVQWVSTLNGCRCFMELGILAVA